MRCYFFSGKLVSAQVLVFLSSVTHALLVEIIVRHSGGGRNPGFLDPAFAGVTWENLRPDL